MRRCRYTTIIHLLRVLVEFTWKSFSQFEDTIRSSLCLFSLFAPFFSFFFLSFFFFFFLFVFCGFSYMVVCIHIYTYNIYSIHPVPFAQAFVCPALVQNCEFGMRCILSVWHFVSLLLILRSRRVNTDTAVVCTGCRRVEITGSPL